MNKKMPKGKEKESVFTGLDLLLVVAILIVLAAVATPLLKHAYADSIRVGEKYQLSDLGKDLRFDYYLDKERGYTNASVKNVVSDFEFEIHGWGDHELVEATAVKRASDKFGEVSYEIISDDIIVLSTPTSDGEHCLETLVTAYEMASSLNDLDKTCDASLWDKDK